MLYRALAEVPRLTSRPNAVLMLGQRRERWIGITPVFDQSFVLAGSTTQCTSKQ